MSQKSARVTASTLQNFELRVFEVDDGEIVICDSLNIEKLIKKRINKGLGVRLGKIWFWREKDIPELNEGNLYSYWVNEGSGNRKIGALEWVLKMDEVLKTHTRMKIPITRQ